jgi:hypothetical protein
MLRLQAAVHSFLARRWLQKAQKKMRDQEAALAVVAFAFNAEGCDLDSLDGYQQLCQSDVVSKGAHGVFPADGVLQLCGDGGREGVFLLVSSGGALPSASQLSVSIGLHRDCFQVVVPLRETNRISADGNPTLCTSVVVPGGLPRAIPISAMPNIHTER